MDKRTNNQRSYPVIYYETDMPLRGKIENLHDSYKFKNKKNSKITIPGWASGTEPNNPIPNQKQNLFDFTYSIFGPPDLPIPAGIAGVEHTIPVENNRVKMVREYNNNNHLNMMANVDRSFYRGEQNMKEHFVTMPFILDTDLPCSVLGFKF